ncbi:GreA/GreB family elongation factor (plasmid) [Deinococcus taeanensis]|uniref:GreA/GreB family elongation factor n=1 Tax=Deinococcus taeanensis TaxID=2737050 RepID=UPI001CDC6667|nr:GreA/GreB family elongation factor [Deinococcus taeanensis]UBV45439.1 GreA/GreB family elongation factor [Deinococcus taeanensis]
MTAGGLERLKQTLEREQVRLDEARDYVRDQMESNEAESLGLVEAQQQLAALEERVEELEHLLATAQVIEPVGGTHDVVSLGDVVLLTELGSGRTQRIQLVSTAEAAGPLGDIVQISSDSPVGSKLEGCRAGDHFTVTLRQREVHYEVTQIEAQPL